MQNKAKSSSHHSRLSLAHALYTIFGTLFTAIWLTLFLSQTASATLTANTPATTEILQAPNPTNPHWETITIKQGDNLGKIFSRLGLDKKQLQAILDLKQAKHPLTKLHTEQKMQILLGANQKLEQLNYPVNVTDNLEIKRQGNTYTVAIVHRTPNTKLKTASVTIQRSLASAATKANLQQKQVKQLIAIFSNNIDFAHGIKAGDRFKVLYETYYAGDKQIGIGEIVAAEFTHQGKIYQAVRYTDPQGHTAYYTPTGTSLQKAFIRTPVRYTYVSSPFSLHRLDPVSNEYRAHRGVDFAAPLGTPIQAAADGKVIFAGVKNGYGNAIVLQHNATYKTLYGHMHHIAKGIHSGSRVQEGQIIGYVGKTGMATGAHLHYEFFVNNVQQNPLTVALPQTKTLAAPYRTKFLIQAKQLMAQLNPASDVRLAENKPKQKSEKQAG